MVEVRGYTEDDVDVLADAFATMIVESLKRAVQRTIDQIKPAVTAAHAFHLPGKHDQLTRGRAASLKVISYDQWGGGFEYQFSDDPEFRDTYVWSTTFAGQTVTRDVTRNLDAGREPFEGVDTEGGFIGVASRAQNFTTGETYGTDAAKDDVLNSATTIHRGLSDPQTFDYELHRGMRVDAAPTVFTPGTEFSSDISSWSTQTSVARLYTTPSPKAGRPESGDRVIMRVTGGRGMKFTSHHASGTMQGEHLLRGDFRVTSAAWRDDLFEVTVEAL
jgi:hypothetical protein